MPRKRDPISDLIDSDWIITCEHAGSIIPSKWKEKVKIPPKILSSHEGIDIGAANLAKAIAHHLNLPYFHSNNTRLLVELNRSLHHPKLFSRFSNHLSPTEKNEIITKLYLPYRNEVTEFIRPIIVKKKPVLHLSIHSFTPIFNGETRNADIGLLYDPKSPGEKGFSLLWQNELQQNFRVRRNYPYLGTADGFVTALRKEFGKELYNGIELEVNQKLLQENPQHVQKLIISSLDTLKEKNE